MFFLQCNVFKTADACYINFPKVFLYQNKHTKSYSKSRRHLYRKISSVYFKFEKKNKINKAVHTVGSHFQVMVWTKIYKKHLRNISGSNWRNFKKHWACLWETLWKIKTLMAWNLFFVEFNTLKLTQFYPIWASMFL